jgi:Regulator of Chromosome Condensation (RCC1) repeat protein
MSWTNFRSIGFILSVVLGGAAGCNRPLALSKPDGAAAVAHGGSTTVALVGATGVVDGGSSIGDGVRDTAIAADVVAAMDASTGTAEVADARLDAASDDSTDAPVHHGALAVAIGDAHACALRDDHTVRCWGEVALADRGPSRPVVAIGAGGSETCAVLTEA